MFVTFFIIQIVCFIALIVVHIQKVEKLNKKIQGAIIDMKHAKLNLDVNECHHCSFAQRKLSEAIEALK